MVQVLGRVWWLGRGLMWRWKEVFDTCSDRSPAAAQQLGRRSTGTKQLALQATVPVQSAQHGLCRFC